MSTITRKKTNSRMSQITIHNGTVYLAGQCSDAQGDIRVQAENVLAKVTKALAEAGSSPRHMLSATVHLRDMADFAGFNAVWDAWVPEGHAPGRTCVEAHLCEPWFLCEVTVIAALAGE